MSFRFGLAAGLVAACACQSPAQAQVITHRDVGVRMGLVIAETALTECEKMGNSISVAVVDRAGRLRVFLQADKANPHKMRPIVIERIIVPPRILATLFLHITSFRGYKRS